jgi:hypothetical protein
VDAAGKKGNKTGNEHKIKADKVYFFDYNTVEVRNNLFTYL